MRPKQPQPPIGSYNMGYPLMSQFPNLGLIFTDTGSLAPSLKSVEGQVYGRPDPRSIGQSHRCRSVLRKQEQILLCSSIKRDQLGSGSLTQIHRQKTKMGFCLYEITPTI